MIDGNSQSDVTAQDLEELSRVPNRRKTEVGHCQKDKPKTRLKMEDIIPHLETVNEICSPLAEQILSDHHTGLISSSEGVPLLLDTRMATLLQHQPARVSRGAKIKLQTHRNEEQRESKAQIVTLQKALDKPLHNKGLSLAVEESFTIMDLRDELILSREIMQTVVRDRYNNRLLYILQ
jgi:hypothetical protein